MWTPGGGILADVIDPEGQDELEEQAHSVPAVNAPLPILALRETIVFPLTTVPLAVGRERSIRLVESLQGGGRLIGLVAQRSPEIEIARPGDMFPVGTLARVRRVMRAPDGSQSVWVQAIERLRVVTYVQEDPYLMAQVEVLSDSDEAAVEVDALSRRALDAFQRLVAVSPFLPDELVARALNLESRRALFYLIASSLRISLEERQELLEIDSLQDRYQRLLGQLDREIELLELGAKLQGDVRERIDKSQREYFLREQLKAIQQELGEEDPAQAELNEIREKVQAADMPDEARREAERELSRLERLPPASPEHSVIRTYLDWLVAMPWNRGLGADIDIARARRVLDEDHYDLEKVKERILEYLAVKKLRIDRGVEGGATVTAVEQPEVVEDGPLVAHPEGNGTADAIPSSANGSREPLETLTPESIPELRPPHFSDDFHEPILCLVGPPGVGKTSLGQSIARALGRKFVRMSLGGVRDEAEVRGHRRTYVGAMPGRVVQMIRRAESNDPVFMLDEIEKIGQDWRGDPSSALLEVLDPEQNRDFRDHYLDVPFDLSRVMFITTANTVDTIHAALRDRMEILTLPGYTENEKVGIARRFLIPKQLLAHGLRRDELEYTDEALHQTIRDYTSEAGVRNLEREIASVIRKTAKAIAEGISHQVLVTPELLREYLGRPKFFGEVAERIDRPGVATGLVYTPVGGDIVFVEASVVPGKKELRITGQLGDVMRESAEAALSFVRSRSTLLGIDERFFETNDIHVHVPGGAIPKDGPSAGITLAVALASALTGRLVRDDVAMTGEITLRGKVLPVGGIKEKVLGAHRAGLRTIILPRRNEADLEELPAALRAEFTIHPVESVDEVLGIALHPKSESERRNEDPPEVQQLVADTTTAAEHREEAPPLPAR